MKKSKTIKFAALIALTPIAISLPPLLGITSCGKTPTPVQEEYISVDGSKDIKLYSDINNYLYRLNFLMKEELDSELKCTVSSQSGSYQVSIAEDITVTGKNVGLTLLFAKSNEQNAKSKFSLKFDCGKWSQEIKDFTVEYSTGQSIPKKCLNIDESGNLYGINGSWEELSQYDVLTIPEEVITIQPSAFEGMPNNIKCLKFEENKNREVYIEKKAFYNCTGLVHLQLPSNLAYVDTQAFWNCSSVLNLDLSTWAWNDTCNPFDDINPFTGWRSNGNIIYTLPQEEKQIKYDLYFMLSCTNLGDSWLDKLDLNLTEEADDTFRYLVNKEDGEKIVIGLVEGQTMPKQWTISPDITMIAPNAFKGMDLGGQTGCRIEFTSANPKLRRIGSHAFAEIKNGGYEAFNLCSSTAVPDYLIVDDYAFADSNVFSIVSLGYSNQNVVRIGKCCFEGSSVTTITGAYDRIAPRAFYNVANFANAYLNYVKWIGQEAFYGTKINTINLGEALYIGKGAFANCTNLKEVSNVSKVVYVDDFAFANTSFETIEVPSSVQYIGNGVFYQCPALKSFNVLAGNEYYLSDNGKVIYGKSNGKLIVVAAVQETLNDVSTNILRKEITDIKPYTFAKMQTTVSKLDFSIFQELKNIGEYAFWGVTSTDGFVINFNERLSTLGDFAFAESDITNAIDILSLPNVQLGSNLFENCKKLSEIIIPDNLTVIPDYLFNYSSVTHLTIKSTVVKVGKHSFANLGSLSVIDLTDFDYVPDWTGDSAFYNVIQDKILYVKVHNGLVDGWQSLLSNLGLNAAEGGSISFQEFE
ncbi:MAG: leucine-rich repeat protein [Mycoplasma sp.]|nr:leucine-rich repeat protein [Candidatus Hennigella equi]